MKDGWNCVVFEELTGNDVYEILKLREAVFILEQQCFYIDIDDVDIDLDDEKKESQPEPLPTFDFFGKDLMPDAIP